MKGKKKGFVDVVWKTTNLGKTLSSFFFETAPKSQKNTKKNNQPEVVRVTDPRAGSERS